MNNDEMKTAFIAIAKSFDVAINELQLKATILNRIKVSLYNQASDSSSPDMIHCISPENLFDSIRNAIKEYEKYK